MDHEKKTNLNEPKQANENGALAKFLQRAFKSHMQSHFERPSKDEKLKENKETNKEKKKTKVKQPFRRKVAKVIRNVFLLSTNCNNLFSETN